ncbi:MAG TPA: HepT-like ribonuclease domain-containing protein [Chlamydiales bacterium]|jgi:uncharacterized protein with HEPN domain|nr:HepT-like ribonuclease domain-containing protein [Chlamydiales bacterium]
MNDKEFARFKHIHVYFDIDYDIIWSSIQNDLPLFCQRLEQIILSLELKV